MKIKTIKDVVDSNLFPDNRFQAIMQQTEYILKEHKSIFSNKDMDISDTPISPMNLDDEYTPILFDQNVVETYEKLVKMINEPDTAVEYSFILLGKSAVLADENCYVIDQLIDCTLYNNLSNRQTQIDEEKLNKVIKKAQSEGYNFISLGHTHPNISEDERKITVANFLTDEQKKLEFIRAAGLNISLQDFVSYESLYNYFKSNPNIRTAQTIIMYNGEIAMFSKSKNKLNRMTIIMDMINGKEIYVSSKEDYKKSIHI